MKKLRTLLLVTVLALSIATVGFAAGQVEKKDYPTRNITCITPYGAGGTMDTLSRFLFESIPAGELPDKITIVSENIPGAGGLVGTEHALQRKADGYTIAGVNGDLIINRAIGATNIVLEESFIPLVVLQDEPYTLIAPATGPLSTLEGFINQLKSGDNGVTIAITGPGSPGGLAAEALSKGFGVKVKTVTYDASHTCALAVVQGECDATFAPVTVVTGQIEANTLKVIGLTTATESPTLPGVPSIAQSYSEVHDMDLHSFCMLGALAGTDEAIVDYLRSVFYKAVTSEQYAKLTAPLMMTPVAMDYDEMTQSSINYYNYYMRLLEAQ